MKTNLIIFYFIYRKIPFLKMLVETGGLILQKEKGARKGERNKDKERKKERKK